MRTSWLQAVTSAVLIASVVAVPAAAADEPPALKELAASKNNLKQIALAFHSYHDVNSKLPGNILDKDGKPLLSWRVAILPFIEEDTLYKQFNLDEAWDSANNKKLIEKLPKVYAPIRVKAKAGETFYQTFVGEGTLFSAKGPLFKLENIADGTSNTALVVEAGTPVVWSKPEDIAFDEKKALPKLGGLFDGKFYVALCDGSVMRVRKEFDEAELKKLIMPADGNVIDFEKLK